jgi:hypothetical protein
VDVAEWLPHPEALRNFDNALIPELKITGYALVDPGKSRPFSALGFSKEAGNWEALRDAILQGLPCHPASYDKLNEFGTYYEVVLPIRGPTGKVAPVKTYWIFRRGEDFPRLATLYIDVKEWSRWEQEREDATGSEG